MMSKGSHRASGACVSCAKEDGVEAARLEDRACGPCASHAKGEPRSAAPQRASSSAEAAFVRASRSTPARLMRLYESRDGKLCLFESADGHLAAVDSSKLA